MSAMICMVLALLGIGGCGPATPSKLPAPGGPCSAQPPGCGSAQGTGPNLAGYTWSAAPAPPLSSRSSQTSVWTGTQLLVWGGMLYNQGLTPAADGAAYDPASGSWTPMPASPLSPRDGAYGFWTGDTALFWGGGNDLGVPLMDGASYDPSDRTWTRVPASPLRVDADARQTVVWTGTQMVVIQPAGGAAFDPATDDWARVPALPSVSGWQSYAISAEWTGSAVVIWVAARPPTVNGITPGGYHFSTYWWAPGGDSWTSIPVVPADNGSFPFGTAASFGGRLLFLGGSDCGPGISCPAGFYGALWYDPSSGKWTGLPNTFSGGAGPAVWTGSAMVVFGSQAGPAPSHSGPFKPEEDAVPTGTAAAFDASTGAWSNLAQCPLSDLNAASLVWTGQQLIVVAMNGDTGKAPQVEVLSRQ